MNHFRAYWMGVLTLLLCFLMKDVQAQDSARFHSNAVKNRVSQRNPGLIPKNLEGIPHHHHHGQHSRKRKRGKETLPAGCWEACATGCVYYGCTVGYELILSGLFNYHLRLLDSKGENERVVSLDILPEGAWLPEGGYQIVPRIRGNWGFLTTDFRIFSDYRSGPGYIETARTFDWQIIMFNLIARREAVLRMGTGLMYDQSTDYVFSEHSVALDLYLVQERVAPRLEFRYALDYGNFESPRWEANGLVDFLLFETRNFSGYFSAGARFQKFALGDEVFAATGGFRFNLH